MTLVRGVSWETANRTMVIKPLTRQHCWCLVVGAPGQSPALPLYCWCQAEASSPHWPIWEHSVEATLRVQKHWGGGDTSICRLVFQAQQGHEFSWLTHSTDATGIGMGFKNQPCWVGPLMSVVTRPVPSMTTPWCHPCMLKKITFCKILPCWACQSVHSTCHVWAFSSLVSQYWNAHGPFLGSLFLISYELNG